VSDLRARGWAVLANSYNAPVLAGNPDHDAAYAYRKAKHRKAGWLELAGERLSLVTVLARKRLDDVVLAAPAFIPRTFWFARLLALADIVGFSASDLPRALDRALPLTDTDDLHEVERVSRSRAFGIAGPPRRSVSRSIPQRRGAWRQQSQSEGSLAFRLAYT